MQINRIRMCYSIIGNIVDFLIKNEQRIKNMCLDYEIETKVDKLNNGQEVKSLLFTKKNIKIRFLPNRVDFDFGFINPNVACEEAHKAASDFFALLGEIFPEICGNRIAILTNGFIDNTNEYATKVLAKNLNFASLFGDCSEVAFKINTPVKSKEELNVVISVDMGGAKNNKTQVEIPVFLISLDVNTHAKNQQNRFSPQFFNKDFVKLYETTLAKIAQFEKLA